jgi:hypothetical protein
MPDKKLERLLPSDVAADDTLYVVDRELKLVYANEAWMRFATGNKGERLLAKDWNPNVLDNMSGKSKERWTHIYRLLLESRLPHHQEELICSSPSERRLYRLRITPKRCIIRSASMRSRMSSIASASGWGNWTIRSG